MSERKWIEAALTAPFKSVSVVICSCTKLPETTESRFIVSGFNSISTDNPSHGKDDCCSSAQFDSERSDYEDDSHGPVSARKDL